MKRFYLLLFTALSVGTAAFAQNEYNYQKRSLFEVLPIHSNDIVFLGDSITDGCEWAELLDNRHVKNRGISADRSGWLLDRIDTIVAGRPKKLFLMIGTNDLSVGVGPDEVVGNIRKLVVRFQKQSPWTKLYIQSILPVNGADFKKYPHHYGINPQIIETNRQLEALCREKGIVYIDLWSLLVDGKGNLDSRYTNDGLHLMGSGYLVWKKAVEKYVKK